MTVIQHIFMLYLKERINMEYKPERHDCHFTCVYQKYSKAKLNCVYSTLLDLPSSDTQEPQNKKKLER